MPYPGAGPGHRKAASGVRFLSKVRWACTRIKEEINERYCMELELELEWPPLR